MVDGPVYREGYEDGEKAARARAVQAIMDLFYALREIDGQPTLKDLVKLAKRIRRN
jgi:hypothetical protein